MQRDYDVLIVGGGPAGLSAALILGRCRRRVLICDNGRQRNLASSAIHGLLGHDGKPPGELLALGRAELQIFEHVQQRSAEVVSILPAAGGFQFQVSDGLNGTAKKVLLTTGLADQLPAIPDIDLYYGKSVHHCLYCDGFEHREQALVAYGAGEKGAGLALMMRHWSDKIVLCCEDAHLIPADLAARLTEEGIDVISAKIARLDGDGGKLQRIELDDGRVIECVAMFFSTGCHQQSTLSAELGCKRDADNKVLNDALTEETSVPGVYVAGDVSRDVLLVAVAVGEGTKAAVAINRALLKEAGLITTP